MRSFEFIFIVRAQNERSMELWSVGRIFYDRNFLEIKFDIQAWFRIIKLK